MAVKNRIKKIEDWVGKSTVLMTKERYVMNNEEIQSCRRALYNLFYSTLPEHGHYQTFREGIIGRLIEAGIWEVNEKYNLSQRFDNFFFNQLGLDDRADFAFEFIFGSNLPDNYEFKVFKNFLQQIQNSHDPP